MVLAGLYIFLAGLAFAGELATPTGKVILTISGEIAVTNAGDSAEFDRAMLESIGMVSFQTSTPWYDKPVQFEGVRLDKLMTLAGAIGDRVRAIALNDYMTEIPIADFAKHGTIIALKRDGEYMPVRDKGPLFIVYPYDSDAALQSQTYYGRSAWQLSKLIVE
ncbi:oxidoreductase [Aurantimonas sp. C2-6-R+9]|nr:MULTISPECIES: oxidoreductase [unclassified Aurantimonas]MEC5293026.1 oxidoreductase [Aurantimonas sp. C2-3-R2]MEC5383345.1 oxidoreductase [Aurantimonas sp. C2-6-R+9]MEC5414038.1 oxidoreductase [Aurantimonas sp. C2-4-R8]